MMIAVPEKIRKAMSAGDPILFVSPHLDDAVLSCGALLEAAAGHCPVTVATVFTTADVPPHTRALADVCLALLNSNEFAYVY